MVSQAVCVGDIGDARAVLHAASAFGIPVDLVTPEGAGCLHGPGYWAALQRELRTEFPDASFRLLVDFADEAGTALRALTLGLKHIIFDHRLTSAKAVADMAEAQSAELLRYPPDVMRFPVACSADHKRALAKTWLSAHAAPLHSGISTEVSPCV